VYSEAFVVPFFHLSRGIKTKVVLESVEAGLAEGARRYGVAVSLIFPIPRTVNEEAGMKPFELIAEYPSPRVVAIDLSGMESTRDIKCFAHLFRHADPMGLATVAHAGEFTSPRPIHEAMDLLAVQRIGYGVTSVRGKRRR
jgi:adenosine deaminase